MGLWAAAAHPDVACEGMLAESEQAAIIDSYVAEGAIKAGLLVQLGTGDEQCAPISALPAADTDSIIATHVHSAATAQVFTGSTTFDGVFGAGLIHPPQILSFTLNNHADWDDTVMKVVGEGPRGELIVEDVVVPNGGNTVLYTAAVFSRVKRIHLPAQTGANGEMTVGTDPTYYAFDRRYQIGVALYDRASEPSATTTVNFDDHDRLSVLRKGRVWVLTEHAVTPGTPVYARAVLAGADVRGQFGGPGIANFAMLPGAFYVTSASADGLAMIELT